MPKVGNTERLVMAIRRLAERSGLMSLATRHHRRRRHVCTSPYGNHSAQPAKVGQNLGVRSSSETRLGMDGHPDCLSSRFGCQYDACTTPITVGYGRSRWHVAKRVSSIGGLQTPNQPENHHHVNRSRHPRCCEPDKTGRPDTQDTPVAPTTHINRDKTGNGCARFTQLWTPIITLLRII